MNTNIIKCDEVMRNTYVVVNADMERKNQLDPKRNIWGLGSVNCEVSNVKERKKLT